MPPKKPRTPHAQRLRATRKNTPLRAGRCVTYRSSRPRRCRRNSPPFRRTVRRHPRTVHCRTRTGSCDRSLQNERKNSTTAGLAPNGGLTVTAGRKGDDQKRQENNLQRHFDRPHQGKMGIYAPLKLITPHPHTHACAIIHPVGGAGRRSPPPGGRDRWSRGVRVRVCVRDVLCTHTTHNYNSETV